MSEQNWTGRVYASWDDAFRGLAPICRQQSVRVAEYTQVLFVAACASGYGRSSSEGAARMKSKYADDAYKCGFYHQLGKALVPPEYQVWQKNFSAEETANYRQYTTAGRLLVATLQERAGRPLERGAMTEKPTRNIAWLMMRESCEQHMERFDGSGYPRGLRGSEISPIAHIVGLAKELDRLSSEMLSEHPFDEAWDMLESQSGSAWAPELIAAFRKCRDACQAIYRKYIQYTNTLPETIPLVRKRDGRPLGMKYRPIVADESMRIVGYEAVPWFGGILGDEEATESGEAVSDMLERADLIADVMGYLLYETGDLAVRLRNCRVKDRVLVVRMLPAFFALPDRTAQMEQFCNDQELDKNQLMLLVDENYLLNAPSGIGENLANYSSAGYTLVLDHCHPGVLSVEQLFGFGFRWLRIAPELYKQYGSAAAMKELQNMGFRLMAGDVADEDTLGWLKLVGVDLINGPLTGEMMTEEEIVRDELAQLR